MITEAMRQHGAFSWNELMTSDVAGAKAFYGELLGWTLTDMESSCGEYTVVKSGEREIAGIMATPAEMQGMPPSWCGYVTVDDVDAMPAQVEKLGGKVLAPPQDIPNVGRFTIIKDPQGAMLMLITYFEQA